MTLSERPDQLVNFLGPPFHFFPIILNLIGFTNPNWKFLRLLSLGASSLSDQIFPEGWILISSLLLFMEAAVKIIPHGDSLTNQ